MSNRNKIKIALFERIPVSDALKWNGIPPSSPVIESVDWNRVPSCCNGKRRDKGKRAVDIIACTGSVGTQVFMRTKSSHIWNPMDIKQLPNGYGTCVQWHKQGSFLASATRAEGQVPGKLLIVSYDSKSECFRAREAMVCNGEVSISCVSWDHTGKFLAAALQPSSEICFFELTDGNHDKLKQLGISRCVGFPDNTKISLHFHPKENFLFSSAFDSSNILIWGYNEEQATKWSILQTVDCGNDIIDMSYDICNDSLVTAQKRNWWKWWKFNKDTAMITLHLESANQHEEIKNYNAPHSAISSIVCPPRWSRGKRCMMASGGDCDTLIVGRKMVREDSSWDWEIACSLKEKVCFGKVTCLKFNPKATDCRLIMTGSTRGFIHFWAVYEGTPKYNIPVFDREYEKIFYDRELKRRARTKGILNINPVPCKVKKKRQQGSKGTESSTDEQSDEQSDELSAHMVEHSESDEAFSIGVGKSDEAFSIGVGESDEAFNSSQSDEDMEQAHDVFPPVAPPSIDDYESEERHVANNPVLVQLRSRARSLEDSYKSVTERFGNEMADDACLKSDIENYKREAYKLTQDLQRFVAKRMDILEDISQAATELHFELESDGDRIVSASDMKNLCAGVVQVTINNDDQVTSKRGKI